jgi:hypothetical protein
MLGLKQRLERDLCEEVADLGELLISLPSPGVVASATSHLRL